MIRLSIIIPFLNSHELVRRQVLWFHKLNLPDEVELIFMDDGSRPPIEIPEPPCKNFRLIPTNDFRPWTSSLARNTAAKIAQGKYFLMTDGDYIVTREAVERGLTFNGDREGFKRYFGILDENGCLRTDHETLLQYGVDAEYLRTRKGKISPHPNNYIIRREVFQMIGGYDEFRILNRSYPQGEDRQFKRDLMKLAEEGIVKLPETDDRAIIYMFPNGQFCGDVDYNPFGLFHNLTRKTGNNYWYYHPKLASCKSVKDDRK
jgi:glycosyltransferase involved in cell wall biosynthesis